MSTYLSILNNLQVRLRETQTAAITTTAYSTLLGQLINQAKREIEDSWDWTALRSVLSFTTSAGTSVYSITGSNQRSRFFDRDKRMINDTQDSEIYPYSDYAMDRITYIRNISQNSPIFYRIRGVSGGLLQVTLYPTPNSADTIIVPMVVPQADLSATSDVVTVPSEPILLRAYYLALQERGDDGGVSTREAADMANIALANAIKNDTGLISDRDMDWAVY